MSKYVLFHGNDYRNPNDTTYEYKNDTLIVEVTAVDDHGFTISEYLAPGSESLDDTGYMSANGILFPDSVFVYRFKIENDTLILDSSGRDYSELRLVWMYGSPLTLGDIDDTLVSMKGWKTSFGYCECYRQGYVVNYRLLGNRYSRLNVIVNDVPMQVDAGGHAFVYSRRSGIVRCYTTNWWTNTGIGWDLL
jgi:hypothetical protein